MKLPPRARWVLYTLLLLLAAAAVWAPEAEEPVELVQPVARTRAAPALRSETPEPGLGLPQARGLAAPLGDPFSAARAAANEAPAAPRAAASQARVHTAPPLPFVYLGRWQERGRTYVFLQRDGRPYKVEQPGPLDSEYAVLAMDDRGMQFRYEPLGLVQELRFDTPPPARPARAVATQAAAPAPPPETDTAEN